MRIRCCPRVESVAVPPPDPPVTGGEIKVMPIIASLFRLILLLLLLLLSAGTEEDFEGRIADVGRLLLGSAIEPPPPAALPPRTALEPTEAFEGLRALEALDGLGLLPPIPPSADDGVEGRGENIDDEDEPVIEEPGAEIAQKETMVVSVRASSIYQ